MPVLTLHITVKPSIEADCQFITKSKYMSTLMLRLTAKFSPEKLHSEFPTKSFYDSSQTVRSFQDEQKMAVYSRGLDGECVAPLPEQLKVSQMVITFISPRGQNPRVNCHVDRHVRTGQHSLLFVSPFRCPKICPNVDQGHPLPCTLVPFVTPYCPRIQPRQPSFTVLFVD